MIREICCSNDYFFVNTTEKTNMLNADIICQVLLADTRMMDRRDDPTDVKNVLRAKKWVLEQSFKR